MTLESYWLENCPYYDSMVIIYAQKMFIRLATGRRCNLNEMKWSLNQFDTKHHWTIKVCQ